MLHGDEGSEPTPGPGAERRRQPGPLVDEIRSGRCRVSRMDLAQHREWVLRRLLARGISADTLAVLLPDRRQLIRQLDPRG